MTAPPSVVLLTTPTSGTGSLWTIITRLCESHAHKIKIVDHLIAAGRDAELPGWAPEPTDHVYMYNAPHIANQNLATGPAKLIVNFRDPRDLACNQFYWALQHPILGRSEADIAAFREAVREKGIDQYVLGIDNTVQFKCFHAIRDRITGGGDDVLLISYAQLCLDFDAMVTRIAAFVGLDPALIPWADMEPMRASKLASNPGWIGKRWVGSDATPGRYLGELQPATIETLDEQYRTTLGFLRSLEAPHRRHLLATRRERSEMQKVMFGRDDQLFLTNDSTEVMQQIAGRRPLPRADMFRIAFAHQSRRQFGATIGDFRYEHMVVPNKECALRDHLPEEVAFEAEGPRPLRQYLASPATRLWRPFYEPELLQGLSGEYFPRTDTHWNHQAAFRYFTAFIGATLPDLAPALEAIQLRRFAERQLGDLGAKLEMAPEPIEILAPQRPKAQLVFRNFVPDKGAVRWYRNPEATTAHRAVVLHDSFGMWLQDLIPELFAEVIFFNGTIFDFDVMERYRPSIVLCLEVERFFPRVPDTGGDMLGTIEAEETAKDVRATFGAFWRDFVAGR